MKANEFIIPFGYVDGVPTLRDTKIFGFYDLMKRDGTLSTVFYDRPDIDCLEFARFMKFSVRLFVYYSTLPDDTDQPLALGWLSHFENGIARCHFCGFKEVWGEDSVRVGKIMSRYMLQASEMSMLYGMTPSWNRLAIRLIRQMGWAILGQMPFGSTDKQGNPCPTTISFFQ